MPKSPTTPPELEVDTIPPATVTDLTAKIPMTSAVLLIWTAPGDDGGEGTADSYDIRYHDEIITEQNWDGTAVFDGEPDPKPAGQIETIKVNGLEPISTYYFALKTTDERGNVSGLSNSDSMTTLQESIPPVKITDLKAVAIDDHTIQLIWTAPGDDGITGTAARYEIRYSYKPISEQSWQSASRIHLSPPPKVGGEPESLLVTGLRSASYCFAMKTADEVPNWSQMSNVACAMGYSVYLELSEQAIQAGDQVTIRFRAPGNVLVSILLNRYTIWDCDPTNPLVWDLIVPGIKYTEGVYEISYGFRTKEGEYLPSAKYIVVLCWQFEIKAFENIEFNFF
jgi:hypothetical protein